MDLNSPLFDRVRATPEAEAPPEDAPRCNHPDCLSAGLYRAPMGREREGQYFSFCLDHVRAYNANYNYFKGMTDDAVARFQREDVVGHRPTWNMGVNRAGRGFREEAVDPREFFRDRGGGARRARMGAMPEPPRPPLATRKALSVLALEESADRETVKARYKELVKRLHPDANGGDRSREEKLREIIQAYNYLRSVRLA